jgi:NADH dehydrogenase
MKPRVVIVGSGFAGLYAARALRRADASVLVLDRTNYHLFQPLLYQVATAVLAPTSITSPIRFLLRKQRNTEVLLEQVARVDTAQRVVIADGGREFPYDYLVLATGTGPSYYGHDEWKPLAPGLKGIEDAREIRHRFLTAFENAEKIDDPQEQAEWLTFVIVGGGPTGVELAGMIPDTARHVFHPEFRRVDTRKTRVILLEGGPRLLPAFPESLAEHARRDLEELGVEVHTNARVTRVTDHTVYLGDTQYVARTVLWAAGNAASPVGRTLGAPLDSVGRVIVEKDLSIPGHPEVFVVGDLAALDQDDGTPVPGVAPAAMQMGRTAAANILRLLDGKPTADFHYFDKGNLATIGRHKAIADFGRVHVTGYAAWWTWLFVHILYLAGFTNRLSVLLQWGYAYITYQRGARLITESKDE